MRDAIKILPICEELPAIRLDLVRGRPFVGRPPPMPGRMAISYTYHPPDCRRYRARSRHLAEFFSA